MKKLYMLLLLGFCTYSFSIVAMESQASSFDDEISRDSRLAKFKEILDFIQNFCNLNNCYQLSNNEAFNNLHKDSDDYSNLHNLIDDIKNDKIEAITTTKYIEALLLDWYAPTVAKMMMNGELPKDGSDPHALFTKFGAELAGEMNLLDISTVSIKDKVLWNKFFAKSDDKTREYAQEACPLETIDGGRRFAHDLLRTFYTTELCRSEIY